MRSSRLARPARPRPALLLALLAGLGCLWVAASRTQSSWDVFVTVTAEVKPRAMRYLRGECPDGRDDEPFEWIDQQLGSYSPGFRGTNERSGWSYRGWRGFTCTARGVNLWPEGRESDRFVSTEVTLSNGHHLLSTSGRSMRETKQLAKEYLRRLGT